MADWLGEFLGMAHHFASENAASIDRRLAGLDAPEGVARFKSGGRIHHNLLPANPLHLSMLRMETALLDQLFRTAA
ncbi:hypothetical protein [Breoghania corrubedonensis]|uniref:hypothetical protein n=1 Tax=Breoghania corrubedonensis TaxID=665038 RepID=UPI000D380F50|nr:hypothetical protein [Breoghania corrubedonensis]